MKCVPTQENGRILERYAYFSRILPDDAKMQKVL